MGFNSGFKGLITHLNCGVRSVRLAEELSVLTFMGVLCVQYAELWYGLLVRP